MNRKAKREERKLILGLCKNSRRNSRTARVECSLHPILCLCTVQKSLLGSFLLFLQINGAPQYQLRGVSAAGGDARRKSPGMTHLIFNAMQFTHTTFVIKWWITVAVFGAPAQDHNIHSTCSISWSTLYRDYFIRTYAAEHPSSQLS